MILALLALLGCAGVLDIGRATPLGPGKAEFRAGTALGVAPGHPYTNVRFAGGLHVGVAPGLELGGGVGAGLPVNTLPLAVSDVSVDAKLRLGPSGDAPVRVALNPRVRLGGFTTVWSPLTVELPVLVGFDIAGAELVAAPRAALVMSVSELPSVSPSLGFTAGCVIPAGPQLELVPAVGVEWLGGEAAGGSGGGEGAIGFAAGLSFLLPIE